MKFGQADKAQKLDLSLPRDDKTNTALLSKLAAKRKLKVNIGCPVWGGQYFLGKVYPKGTKADKFLYHYAKNFNSIELNSMLYRIPKTEAIKEWTGAVGAGFIFCPKFPNLITHRIKEQPGEDRITKAFLRACRDFGKHLGMSFLQLPPYFKPERLEWLFRYLDTLPKKFNVGVEVRNPEWFTNKAAQKDLFEGLAERGICAVITDAPGRRDVIHQRLTSDKIFIRFNGRDGHPSDNKRLAEWASKLIEWEKKGIREINFFLHSPDKVYSPDLNNYLIGELNKKVDWGLKPAKIIG